MIGFGKPTAKTDASGAAVVEPSASAEKAGNGADKRRSRHIRTSLRTGQLYDMRNNFLCDCQVRDRSVGGAKLRLLSNIAVPTLFKFHDDVECTLVEAELRWRNKNEIGIQFTYTVSLG